MFYNNLHNIDALIFPGKLQNCSSYSYGNNEVVAFRAKKVKKANNPVLVTFLKTQKTNAETDVREIMKILNFVLRDSSCLRSSISTASENLVCKEDYSSVYRVNCPVQNDFRLFIAEQQNSLTENSTSILNLNELLDATEPEAILVSITNCNSYGKAYLTVRFSF
jgi:hypothetical protein